MESLFPEMPSLFPKKPATDGSENQKKAYQLWLLASKISDRLNFVKNPKTFSSLERLIFASNYILWEMTEYKASLEDLDDIRFDFLEFPRYELAKTGSDLRFRIKPIIYAEAMAALDTEREFDRVLGVIQKVDTFLESRISLYRLQLGLFFGPGEALIPHLAAFLIYTSPLRSPDDIDLYGDYWKLNDRRVVEMFTRKLDAFHGVIKKHLDPILLT